MPDHTKPSQKYIDIVTGLEPVLPTIAQLIADAAAPRIARLLASSSLDRATCDQPLESSWLAPADVERIYSIPQKTLANWRSARKGPPFRKFGRHVRYNRRVLEAWLSKSGGAA